MTSMAARPTTSEALPGSVTELASRYRRALEAQGKRPRTVETYLEALARLDAFLARSDLPRRAAPLGPDHVQAFIEDVQRQQSAATAIARYRALQSFFRWCEEAGEIERSPMVEMRAPAALPAPTSVIPRDALGRLLEACDGREFRDLRDMAIVRLFIDTGLRRSELATLRVADIDLAERTAAVPAKGGAMRKVAFTESTARAVERYQRRARARHPYADSDALWLGHGGPMTGNGIYQAIEARATAAGLERIHPHQFRQTFAQEQVRNGAQAPAATGSNAVRVRPSRGVDAATLRATEDLPPSELVSAEPASEPLSAEARPSTPAAVAPPPDAGRPFEARASRSVDFAADLVDAMRIAAGQAGTAMLDQVRADGTTAVGRIEALASADVAEMRRQAVQDIAAIHDWETVQVTRIHEEAELRATARDAQLDGLLQAHADVVEHDIETVRARIAAFEMEMARFVDELGREADPAAFAARAANVPTPPSFQDFEKGALVRAAGDASVEAEPGAAAASSEAAAAPMPADRTTTRVVATGLASLPSIARFKRQVAGLTGIRRVSVSSGPDGTVVFDVTHDPAKSLGELSRALAAFRPEIVERSEWLVEVQVRNPAT